MTAVLTPQEWAAQETEREAKAWLRDIPQALLESFDVTRHPSPDSHAQVMQWKSAAPGLMLSGVTGRGKSRSMAQLIRRLAYEGVRTAYWSVPRLADRISGLALESVSEMDRLIRGLEHCGLLALDDLGAHRPTERVAAELHRIIDTRYAEGRPMLVTTNCTPAQLQEQLLDEHGRTIRRLREMTRPIPF